MQKRSAAKKGRDKQDGDSSNVKSDEQILAERKRLESFDVADLFLTFLSWGLWALAGIWFFYFPGAPTATSFLSGVGEGTVLLLICGQLAGALATSSPKGAWSLWRCPWHFCWAFGLIFIGAACANFSIDGKSRPASRQIVSSGRYVGLGCAAFACAAVYTYPRGMPSPARTSSVLVGRALLIADGVLGFALVGSIAMGGLPDGALGEHLGRCAFAVAAVPLCMWSAAACCCRSDNELLAVVPSAILFHVVAAGKSVLLHLNGDSSFDGALISHLGAAGVGALATLLHLSLYLPLPRSDPDSNPFNMSFQRSCRRWYRLMSQPVSGFGDDGES